MKIDSPNAIGISTGFGIPTGGTANQVLSKINGNNYNTIWKDASSPTTPFTASTNITRGYAVRLRDNGTIIATNTISGETFPIIGIAQQSGTTGSTVQVAVEGSISEVHTGLLPGYNYYSDANGLITTTGDTYVGIALSPTQINVSFSNPGGITTPSLNVIDNTITNPENISTPGRYIVPVSGLTGSFVGNANDYADYNGVDFTFILPTNGDKVSISTGPNAGNVYLFTSGATSGWTLSSQSTTLPTSNWSIGVSYKQNDLVIYQNVLYQANGNIPANTAFTTGISGATWKPIGSGTGSISTSRSATLFTTIPGGGAVGTDFTGVTFSVGTIPLSTSGVWTLSASVTYQIECSVTYDAGGTNQFQGDTFIQFVDATTNTPLPNQNGASTMTPFFTTRGLARNGYCIFQYTPSTNQTIKLRATFQNSAGGLNAQTSITQLGTTNTSAFTGVISPSWNIGNTYPLGTMVVNNSNLYQANSFIGANTPFNIGTTGATWTQISEITQNWVLGNSYTSGTTVINNGIIYQSNGTIPANTAFSLGTTGTTWRQVAADANGSYSSNKFYSSGALVVSGNSLYRSNSIIPSGTTFSVGTTGTTWSQIVAGVPTGGTTNQILSKTSSTNYSTAWVDSPVSVWNSFILQEGVTGEAGFLYEVRFDTTSSRFQWRLKSGRNTLSYYSEGYYWKPVNNTRGTADNASTASALGTWNNFYPTTISGNIDIGGKEWVTIISQVQSTPAGATPSNVYQVSGGRQSNGFVFISYREVNSSDYTF